MQLALTPEVLFPLGACAVVAAAVIAVVVVLVRSRGATDDDLLPPTAADWTGEAATADPVPVERPQWPVLPPRLTVAEAVAVREADTTPLPVVSAAYVPVRSVPAVAEPVAARSRDAEDDDAAEPAPAVPAGPDAAADPVEPAAPPAATEPAAAVGSHGTSPAAAAGSSPSVAVAVAHALAARAAAHREPVEAPVPSRTADARDRLLAVLLSDPVRAVGAAEELATCRGQLGEVLSRLAASGLTTDQLARLSGFSTEQVTTLMARQNA